MRKIANERPTFSTNLKITKTNGKQSERMPGLFGSTTVQKCPL